LAEPGPTPRGRVTTAHTKQQRAPALAFEFPTTLLMSINMRTAKALGLATIVRADEVID
jgi:hypothetical protein